MPVRVGIYTRFCIDDRDILKQVIIHAETVRPFGGSNERIFILGKLFCLFSSLLKDNQVTAYFCACTVRKEVVRQTDGGHQTGMLHELVANILICLRVQNTLRGDVRQYAAGTEVVQSFEKEIVVQALCSLLTDKVLAPGKGRVEYGHIAKGNVGRGEVKMIQVTKSAILKAGNTHFCLRMEVREDFAGQQVFFITDYLRMG